MQDHPSLHYSSLTNESNICGIIFFYFHFPVNMFYWEFFFFVKQTCLVRVINIIRMAVPHYFSYFVHFLFIYLSIPIFSFHSTEGSRSIIFPQMIFYVYRYWCFITYIPIITFHSFFNFFFVFSYFPFLTATTLENLNIIHKWFTYVHSTFTDLIYTAQVSTNAHNERVVKKEKSLINYCL